MDDVIKTLRYESPYGILLLGSVGERLCLCDWLTEKDRHSVCRRVGRMLQADFVEGSSAVMRQAILQLEEYFAGIRRDFDIPLVFSGTDFQVRVWKELLEIPYGQTVSYKELANRTGMPKAVRAVANANGANPISIFVPCHRVIGSDGSLTGYGGGVEIKLGLLELEGCGALI